MSSNNGPVGPRSMMLYEYKTPRSRQVLGAMRPGGSALEEFGLRERLESQGFEFETQRDNKSIYSINDLFSALEKYSDWYPDFDHSDQKLKDALNIAMSTFGGDGSLTPINDYLELYASIKPDKSSGIPEFTSKKDSFERDLKRMQRFNRGKRGLPCVAYHRVQHGVEGPKTRLVWGYPQSVTLAEARFARPLIEKFLSMRTPMAFGLRKMDLSTRLTPIENSNVRYGLDMSGFDSSVPPWMIDFAFKILSTWFDMSQEGTQEHWDYIVRYFIHTPILMPDSYVYIKHMGVPSGSYFTQLIDSICNFIVVQYCYLCIFGKKVTPEHISVLGDDSIFSSDKYAPISQFKTHAEKLGFRVNDRKSEISRFGKPYHFLGHAWDKGRPDRELQDLAIRAVFPERRSGIEDPIVRRNTKLASLYGDALSGADLLRAYLGDVPLRGFSSSDVDLDKAKAGLVEGREAQGIKSSNSNLFELLATGLWL